MILPSMEYPWCELACSDFVFCCRERTRLVYLELITEVQLIMPLPRGPPKGGVAIFRQHLGVSVNLSCQFDQ